MSSSCIAESPSLENYSCSIADYTLSRPSRPSNATIVFVPGMACNRYGHPFTEAPKHAVHEALFEIAWRTHNIVFPDIHLMSRLTTTEELPGSTVEQQIERLLAILKAASNRVELGCITLVAQSLGCLVLAALARDSAVTKDNTSCVLWGAPTYEGAEHRRQLVSMFAEREKTTVDESGNGYIQFGDGRLMRVIPAYWSSIDRASLREHYCAMISAYSSIIAFCARNDSFYPNNRAYLSRYAPGIRRIEVPGASHTFKPDDMKVVLRASMDTLLHQKS